MGHVKFQLILRACFIGALAAAPRSSEAQDFGKLLERAAKDTLRQAIAPPANPANPANPGLSRPGGVPRIPQVSAIPGVPGAPRQASPAFNQPASLIPGAFPQYTPRAETHAIKTADGWTLVARRYPPTARPARPAPPVILCHGLTYNARFWDLGPSTSFAEYLASQGFDVWAVDLRGSGLSQKWVWSLEKAPEALIGGALRRSTKGKFGPQGYESVDPKYANWTMDDHIAHDVPALVHLVRKSTGADQVAWVGHSMGGIVALAHLARFQNPGIGRLVTIGSQLTMPEGRIPGQFLRELITTRQRQVSGALQGPELIAQSRTSVNNLFFNVNNTSSEVYDALTTWAAEMPSIGLMQQYLNMADKGVLMDSRRQFNYAASASNVTVPILIGCGASDTFAPPSVQKTLYEQVGSADKSLVVFGRAGGFAADAGHDDALVGLNSRDQVFPYIARWLAAAH